MRTRFILAAMMLVPVMAQALPSTAITRDPYGIVTAASQGDAKEVKRHLDAGADPDSDDIAYCHDRPLAIAADLGFIDVVKVLLDYGSDPNKLGDTCSENTNKLPLSLASYRSHFEIVKLLIARGAKNQSLALNVAVTSTENLNKLETVRVLLDAGADSNAVGLFHRTPLANTLKTVPVHLEVVKLLLARGANPNKETSLSNTKPVRGGLFIDWMLEKSAIYGKDDEIFAVMNLLVDAGADVNVRTPYKADRDFTPLYVAARMELNPEVAELLIKSGAKVNERVATNSRLKAGEAPFEYYGETALESAIVTENGTALIQLLIKNGADVNMRSNHTKETPIFLATHFGHVSAAKILINAGAQLNLKNWQGLTPLCLAQKLKNSTMIKLLKGAGARCSS